MRKKGQAAMEFLMTYGWAILAAIIVVGVLWYLIGNPANLAGDKFQVSAPLVANAMALSTTIPNLVMEIRNGAGNSITISDVLFDAGAGCTDLTAQSIVIPQGQLSLINVTCTLGSGDRLNSDVTFKYTELGSSVTQQSTGSISGQVP